MPTTSASPYENRRILVEHAPVRFALDIPCRCNAGLSDHRLLEAQIIIVAGKLQGVGDGQIFEQIGREPMTVILEPREKRNIEHDVAVTQWGPFVGIINVNANSGR
jgi:hypothetical protein